MLPDALLRLSSTTIAYLNQDLVGIARSPCLIRTYQVAITTNSLTYNSAQDQRVGIAVTDAVDRGDVIFVEQSASTAVQLHETEHTSTCKYCRQDTLGIPGDREDDEPKRFCNDECFRKFTQFVRAPGNLLASYLRKAVEFANPTARNPLECPEIVCLSVKYDSTMSLSYKITKKAINELDRRGIVVFSNSLFDGAMVMNILARVQHNAFAFDVDEDTAKGCRVPRRGYHQCRPGGQCRCRVR